MQKFFAATIIAFLLITTFAMTALGNADSLGAENGKLLPPSGLGLDLDVNFGQRDQTGPTSTPAMEGQLSYGLFPSVTIAGEFTKTTDDAPETLVKGYFSPMHEKQGYTAYLGYNLNKAQIEQYGISFWTDFNLAFAFLNMEIQRGEGDSNSFTITPGLNLRLGSRLRLAAEAGLDPGNLESRTLAAGASYALAKKFQAKVKVEAGTGGADRVYTTGVSVQL